MLHKKMYSQTASANTSHSIYNTFYNKGRVASVPNTHFMKWVLSTIRSYLDTAASNERMVPAPVYG
jgi:hypothetical protein